MAKAEGSYRTFRVESVLSKMTELDGVLAHAVKRRGVEELSDFLDAYRLVLAHQLDGVMDGPTRTQTTPGTPEESPD